MTNNDTIQVIALLAPLIVAVVIGIPALYVFGPRTAVKISSAAFVVVIGILVIIMDINWQRAYYD